MNFRQKSCFDKFVSFGNQGMQFEIVDSDHRTRLAKMAEADLAFKKNQKIAGLLDYKTKKEQTKDISEADKIEDQDALKLMNMVIGGYVDDQFATYLSYNDFQQKKADFDVLKSVYQSIHKKYRNKKIQESKLAFRSILLMVYLEQNIPKLSRVRIEQIFDKNKIVW